MLFFFASLSWERVRAEMLFLKLIIVSCRSEREERYWQKIIFLWVGRVIFESLESEHWHGGWFLPALDPSPSLIPPGADLSQQLIPVDLSPALSARSGFWSPAHGHWQSLVLGSFSFPSPSVCLLVSLYSTSLAVSLALQLSSTPPPLSSHTSHLSFSCPWGIQPLVSLAILRGCMSRINDSGVYSHDASHTMHILVLYVCVSKKWQWARWPASPLFHMLGQMKVCKDMTGLTKVVSS